MNFIVLRCIYIYTHIKKKIILCGTMLVEIVWKKKILFQVYIEEKKVLKGLYNEENEMYSIPLMWGYGFYSQLYLYRRSDDLSCDRRIRALGIHLCCRYFTWRDFWSGSCGLRSRRAEEHLMWALFWGAGLSNTHSLLPCTKPWQENLLLCPPLLFCTG